MSQHQLLLLLLGLPPTPSSLRVRVWRRLRSLGAVALKRSAYLLPDTPERYEDFQWLTQEVERDGGEATLIRVQQIENVDGTGMALFLAAASEGDSDENARGLSLGSGGTLWALRDAEHADDPKETIVFRVVDDCLRLERMTTPPDGDFAATDLAVDGTTLYLLVPGTGIVTHAFVPDPTPSC